MLAKIAGIGTNFSGRLTGVFLQLLGHRLYLPLVISLLGYIRRHYHLRLIVNCCLAIIRLRERVCGVVSHYPRVREDHERVGVEPYGESKVEAEKVCEEFRNEGLCVPIVRPKTFIGTGRLGVCQILYDWVEDGCKIPVIGDGENRYQLLEVEDLCNLIYLCAIHAKRKVNDTFNVGAEQFATVNEDVGALCEYAGTGARVLPTPAWLVKPFLAVAEALHLSPLYKWVYGTADTDSYVAVVKIKDRLRWSAQYSNVEALIGSYQWYLDNKTEADSATGVTHRVAWKQGSLGLLKMILK